MVILAGPSTLGRLTAPAAAPGVDIVGLADGGVADTGVETGLEAAVGVGTAPGFAIGANLELDAAPATLAAGWLIGAYLFTLEEDSPDEEGAVGTPCELKSPTLYSSKPASLVSFESSSK